MTVFIAMAGDNYYPCGEDDIIGVYSTYDKALEVLTNARNNDRDWYVIVESDLDSGVKQSSRVNP